MAECFRYGITPTDVDLLVERNGFFHFQEWKPSVEAFLKSTGQRICMAKLALLPRTVCYLVVGEPPDAPETVYTIPDLKPIAHGKAQYLKLLSDWFEGADSRNE